MKIVIRWKEFSMQINFCICIVSCRYLSHCRGFPQLHVDWKYLCNSFWNCSWLCIVGSGYLKLKITKRRRTSASSSVERASWLVHFYHHLCLAAVCLCFSWSRNTWRSIFVVFNLWIVTMVTVTMDWTFIYPTTKDQRLIFIRFCTRCFLNL